MKKVGVIKEEKQLSYYRFFEQELAPVPQEKLEILKQGPSKTEMVSFEEKDLKSVRDFPSVPLQEAGRELFRVLLNYRLEPEHLLEEMKALVDEEVEGKEELSPEQMMDIVREVREALQSGKRPFPAERAPEDRE